MTNEKDLSRADEKRPMQEESFVDMRFDEVLEPETYFTILFPKKRELFSIKGKEKTKPEDLISEEEKTKRLAYLETIKTILAQKNVSVDEKIDQLAKAVPIITQHNLERWNLLGPLMAESNAEIKSNKAQMDGASDEIKSVLRQSNTDLEKDQIALQNSFNDVVSEVARRNIDAFFAKEKQPSYEEALAITKSYFSTYVQGTGVPSYGGYGSSAGYWMAIQEVFNSGKLNSKNPPSHNVELAWASSLERMASELFPDLSPREKIIIRKYESSLNDHIKKRLGKIQKNHHRHSYDYKGYQELDFLNYKNILRNVYIPLSIMKRKLENELRHSTLDQEEKLALKTILLVLTNQEVIDQRVAALTSINIPYDEVARLGFGKDALSPHEDTNDPFIKQLQGLFKWSQQTKKCREEAENSLMAEGVSLSDTAITLKYKYPEVFTPLPGYSVTDTPETSKDNAVPPLQDHSQGKQGKGLSPEYGGEGSGQQSGLDPEQPAHSGTKSSDSKSQIAVISDGLLVAYDTKPIEDRPKQKTLPFTKGNGFRIWTKEITTDRDIREAHANHQKKNGDCPLMRLGDIEGHLSVDTCVSRDKDFFLFSAKNPSGDGTVNIALLHSECHSRTGITPAQLLQHIETCKRNKTALNLALHIKAENTQEASTSKNVSEKPRPPSRSQ